jgi:hypothetical protein
VSVLLDQVRFTFDTVAKVPKGIAINFPLASTQTEAPMITAEQITPYLWTQNCSREMRLPSRNSPIFVICCDVGSQLVAAL